jgi:hypothetical protein
MILRGSDKSAPIRNILTSGSLKSVITIGAPGRIRTCDLRLRSPLLYPAELPGRLFGAGRENRTLLSSLENSHSSR